MRHQSLWLDRIFLLVVLLLALALRVYRLDSQSLWYDEAVTAQVAAQGVAELTRWTAADIQPPLYYYAVAGWLRLAGRGEWALRFPSAFFGVLLIPSLWAAGRRLFGKSASGRSAAATVAFLAAVSPLYVYYGQEARMYTMLVFWGVLAGYGLLRVGKKAHGRLPNARADRRRRVRWWGVFVVASAAMLYTHYFGVFLLLAYGLCLLAAWLPRLARCKSRAVAGQFLGEGVLAALAIFLLYLPWLPSMLSRYRVDRSYWQGGLKLGEALRHVAISFTSGAPEMMLEADAALLLPWYGLTLGAALLVLVWSAYARGLQNNKLPHHRHCECPMPGGDPAFRQKQSLGGASCATKQSPQSEEDCFVHDARNNCSKQSEGKAWINLPFVLVIPLVAVLGLASRSPKFNARYLMMVSPAYLLMLAGGVGVLLGGKGLGAGAWGQGRRSAVRNRLRSARWARAGVAGMLVGLSLVGSAVSLRNWFTDPAFTKAQWRELAGMVRAEISPDEAVLLVSGHASPAWDYYAADIPRTRLPDIDVLDVEAVLDFDAGPALADALGNRTGVWVVLWQEDAVDPLGFVPYYLDRAGRELPLDRSFWHVGLRHWQLRPDAAYPNAPAPDHADGANYAHQIALLGWDDPSDGAMVVYWQTINTVVRDYRVSLILEDEAGVELGRWDSRPAGYDLAAGYTFPTFRWRPGEAKIGRYPLPFPSGVADGDYYVTLALYDENDPDGLDIMDVADNPAGKRARLGPISVRF